MNRRTFLEILTAAAVLPRHLSWAAAENRIEKIGLQLYTVRDQMKAAFDGTIAKVASIGYKEVKQPDGWKRAIDTFNHAGEISKKSGIQFAYHNHWFEFLPVNGKLPYDMLLEQCDPDLVKMELDLCWITVAGADPLTYFNRYPGRFPLVHVKDMKKLPKVSAAGGQDFGDSLKDMTEVGSGIIDWKRILGQSEKAGIKHYIVEHDKPQAPIESIKISYDYLSKLRF